MKMKPNPFTTTNKSNATGSRFKDKPNSPSAPIDTLPTDRETGKIEIDNEPKPTDDTLRKGPVGNRI